MNVGCTCMDGIYANSWKLTVIHCCPLIGQASLRIVAVMPFVNALTGYTPDQECCLLDVHACTAHPLWGSAVQTDALYCWTLTCRSPQI